MNFHLHKKVKLAWCNYAGRAWILFFSVCAGLNAQEQRYEVKLAPFSTQINNEFSPVFYGDGIVFCSDQRDNSMMGYSNGQHGLYKLFYTAKGRAEKWQFPGLFSAKLTSGYNDGPATFTADGMLLYFSRNNFVEKTLRSIDDPSNKLGIYSMTANNGKWSEISPFPHNNQLYSVTTPAISADGKRLYFSSDMPGGKGGMDLYFCSRVNEEWSEPVNMGGVINTAGNEIFPFVDHTGRLFFSSDGWPGLGGKDIFYTMENRGQWVTPIHLEPEINSAADDFGMILDSTLQHGYFSSNRLKTDDIFIFSLVSEEFADCDTVKETSYCYTFYDERHQLIDTIHALYKWDFGSGMVRIGPEVQHCFPGPGTYTVKLDITDEITGDTIAEQVEYQVKLTPDEQANILFNSTGIKGQPLCFEAQKPCCDDFTVSQYWWDFGEGFKPGGESMQYTFHEPGVYTVRLGMVTTRSSDRSPHKLCASKQINIFDACEELSVTDSVTDKQIRGMKITGFLMDNLSPEQKHRIRKVFENIGGRIGFDRFGVLPESNVFLDKIAAILIEDHEIKLEIAVHLSGDGDEEGTRKISEQYAQVLAFCFRNRGTIVHSYPGNGICLSGSPIGSYMKLSDQVAGMIEIIFMKR